MIHFSVFSVPGVYPDLSGWLKNTHLLCGYQLFIQNKPNFQKAKMNLSFYSTKYYEKERLFRRRENKPKQTQPVVSLPALSKVEVSNLFYPPQAGISRQVGIPFPYQALLNEMTKGRSRK
jgi:hypothetical protein